MSESENRPIDVGQIRREAQKLFQETTSDEVKAATLIAMALVDVEDRLGDIVANLGLDTSEIESALRGIDGELSNIANK